MYSSIFDLYCLLNKGPVRVYVFPQIFKVSKYNAYLTLLYQEYYSTSGTLRGITLTTPHPLSPIFLLRRLSGEPSIVHHHWLQFEDIPNLFVLVWKLMILSLYKGFGGKLIWSVHNLQPHAGRYIQLNTVIMRMMARKADLLHVHNECAIPPASVFLDAPAAKFAVVPHPPYPVQKIDKKKAVDFLCSAMAVPIDPRKPLFLMYGSIATYKGIIEVIRICAKHSLQLIIAGKAKPREHGYLDLIKKEAHGNESIVLKTEDWISETEEMNLLNASDCAVFNFSEILTSGSVVLARSYGKAVIVPNKGCLVEIDGPDVYHFTTLEELEGHLVRLGKRRES